MKELKLPPIRRLIKPDPGHMLFDCDQSGADAQVVAWEAQDRVLMDAFRAGLDIHNFNGRTIWGDDYNPKLIRRKLEWREECKRCVHGTNYLAGIYGLARILGWTPTEVGIFQNIWFQEHPGIREWHRRLEYNIQKTRTIRNAFGFQITYFDRPDNVLPKACAWIPQSTVANITERAAINLDENLPWVEVLLQVHDSVIFQVPFHRVTPSNLQVIKSHLEIPVPYPDPLVIPWSLKCSKVSWGDLSPKLDWETLEPKAKAA